MRDWRCGGGYKTAEPSKMELFVTIVYRCQLLLTVVSTNTILDVAAALDSPPYANI